MKKNFTLVKNIGTNVFSLYREWSGIVLYFVPHPQSTLYFMENIQTHKTVLRHVSKSYDLLSPTPRPRINIMRWNDQPNLELLGLPGMDKPYDDY